MIPAEKPPIYDILTARRQSQALAVASLAGGMLNGLLPLAGSQV